MKKIWDATARWLIALIAFAIPFDHKYDKPLRFLSAKLTPVGFSIPPWFEKRISYYTSDILVLVLLLVVLCALRVPLRRLILEKGSWLLWIIFGCALLSIFCSSFSAFPIPYIRVGHLATAFLLYGVISSMETEQRTRTFKLVLSALIATGAIQSGIAISQYFKQGSLGLKILGEIFIYPSDQFPFILVAGNKLWVFSSHQPSSVRMTPVLRAMGTFSHPNILGGFLTLSGLLTLFSFSQSSSRKKIVYGLLLFLMIFAMTTTYSRSAFFGLLIGTGLWILLRIFSKEPFPTRSILLLLIGSFSIVGFLFQEQIIQRGGMVNSNKFSEDSDNVRLSYQLLAFRMISDNPLTGVGYGQFNIHSPKYMAPNQNPAMNRSATHNIYLLLASETGLLSLFAYLSFIGLLLWKSIRSPQTPLISILTAIFFAFLFIGGCDFYLLLFQQGRIMFFLVTGLLASQFWLEKRSPNLSGLPSLQGQ